MSDSDRIDGDAKAKAVGSEVTDQVTLKTVTEDLPPDSVEASVSDPILEEAIAAEAKGDVPPFVEKPDAKPAVDFPKHEIPSVSATDLPPVSETVVAPVKAQKSSRGGAGFLGSVLGGVIAVAAGYGLAIYAPIPGLIGQSGPQLADLENRLAALESRPTPDATLAERLAALETKPAPEVKAPDLSPLQEALAALDQRVGAMESRPAAAVGVMGDGLSPEQLDLLRNQLTQGVAAKVAEAEASLAAAQDQAKKLEASASETAAKIAQRAALGQIRVAMDAGQPYAGALQELGLSDLPDVMTRTAAGGIPSLGDLAQDFPAAARAALETSLKADMGDTWGQRFTSFLQTTSGARSLEPREGSDPDAVLSRAEGAVASGDLAKALGEIASLPAEGQAKMASWVERATLRQDALAALDAVSTRVGE